MKSRICPYRKHCHDSGACETCDHGIAYENTEEYETETSEKEYRSLMRDYWREISRNRRNKKKGAAYERKAD